MSLLRIWLAFNFVLLCHHSLAQASFCQQVFTFRQSQESLLELYQFQQNLSKKMALVGKGKNLQAKQLQVLNEFIDLYTKTLQEKVDPENVVEFFKLTESILSHEAFKENLEPYVSSVEIKTTLERLFDFDHSKMFLSLRGHLNKDQVQALFEQLMLLPSLKDLGHYTELNHGWWKLIWLAKMSLTPETALNDLMSIFKGNDNGTFQPQDSRMEVASIIGIMDHKADIINVLNELPPQLRNQYRRIIQKHFYVDKKYPPALAFLQKLNHPPLRDLVKRLQHHENDYKLTRQRIIEEIDQYWQSNANMLAPELGGSVPRGGYSFTKVLNAASAIQNVLKDFGGFLGTKHHLILFGSFPNGMASFHSEKSRMEYLSDFDVTFYKNQAFFAQNLQGHEWFVKGNREHKLYQLLYDLEQSMLQSIGVEATKGGHWISPMTQFSREQILEKYHFGHGAYPMLYSPIALEVSPSRILVHIHLLREGHTQAETLSFEVPNP